MSHNLCLQGYGGYSGYNGYGYYAKKKSICGQVIKGLGLLGMRLS